jgi:hypothetical protein
MTAALTPALALSYLAELEPALEAVAIIASDGTTLAGDPTLAASGKALLVARSSRHAVIARARPGALSGLVRHDLEAVTRELG